MKKILIIKQSSLGDIVHSLPVLSAIKEENANNVIGFVVGDKFQDIVKDHPLIDHLYVIPRQEMKQSRFKLDVCYKYYKIIKEIRRQKYDIALDLQGIIKSGIILGFCGAKRRITKETAREKSTIFANEKISIMYYPPEYRRSVLNHLRTLEYATGIKCRGKVNCILPKSKKESKEKIDNLLKNIDKSKKTIVISPATTWPNKHWSEKHWGEVLDGINKKYNIIFTGGKTDKELVNRLILNSEYFSNNSQENILNICGKTNLNELVEVYRRSDVVISPDSGSAHVAWGTGVPSVITIFCATPANIYGPYGEKHFSFPENSNCICCHKRDCPKTVDRYKCCSYVESEEVLNAVDKAINKFLVKSSKIL